MFSACSSSSAVLSNRTMILWALNVKTSESSMILLAREEGHSPSGEGEMAEASEVRSLVPFLIEYQIHFGLKIILDYLFNISCS